MRTDLPRQFSGKNLRSIAFGAISFATVSCFASYFISQRVQIPMGDEVTFEGWSIALRLPADWTRDEQVTDLSGADVHVFRPKSNRKWGSDAILRVRRSSGPDVGSSKEYAHDVLAQFAAIAGFDSLSEVSFEKAKMGDWSAALGSVNRRRDPFRNQLGLHVQILTGVSPRNESAYGYSVDLQTVGPISGREQEIWKKILKSIRTVNVRP